MTASRKMSIPWKSCSVSNLAKKTRSLDHWFILPFFVLTFLGRILKSNSRFESMWGYIATCDPPTLYRTQQAYPVPWKWLPKILTVGLLLFFFTLVPLRFPTSLFQSPSASGDRWDPQPPKIASLHKSAPGNDCQNIDNCVILPRC